MRLVTLFFCLILVSIFDIEAQVISLDSQNTNHFTITKNEQKRFSFVNSIVNIDSRIVKTKSGDFVKLIVPSYTFHSKNIGKPELPVLHKLVQVPAGSHTSINIIHKEEEIIDLDDYGISLPILPHQPSLSKGDDAANVPFYFNTDYYSEDVFSNDKLVAIEILGKMRGQQLARLSINPFSYNPVMNVLKIIKRVEIEITFNNIDYYKDKQLRSTYYSREFENLYKKCINYLPVSSKDVITTYPVKYVIISDPMFQTALQPLIEWKTKKGFTVIEGYTNDPNVGNTTASIHAFLDSLYDNATVSDPAPTYLLLVGDDTQIPSFSGNTGSHISDMYYCEFDGFGDFYPEMYYGRFSATNTGELESQIHKTLTHEKYTFTDPTFLEEVVLVAGVDASMATTYGNGQINYGTDYYFNTTHGLVVNNYLYGSGTPITSDMPQASAAIISDISDGCSFANYTAHCGSAGWSDPSFETSDIPSLQNLDKYGVLIGNCCQSNKFDVNECFGEALLRASNKGAVGYIGGSNNTYWDEDYWWAVGNTSNFTANPTYNATGLGVYDCLMHENGEHKDDWFITQGQIIHSGNLAVTQAGGAEEYYWEIYHVMGDPSLMPYIGIPSTLNVTHSTAMPAGITTLNVLTEADAYVALSMNGILLDAQVTDSTGSVDLNFSSISNIGLADIVVTKQFRQPYINTIQIVSPNGPFVVYTTHTIDDISGNNNGLIDYDELIDLNVSFQNVGNVNTQNLNVRMITNNPYITLIDSIVSISILNASQISFANSPFSFQVSSFIPDQYIMVCDFIITDNNNNTWNASLPLTLNAPELNVSSRSINDIASGNSNGSLDAGETLDFIIDITNLGHSEIDNIISNLSTNSNYITINNSAILTSILNPNQQNSVVFSITVDPLTPVGTLVEFNLDISDGIYTCQDTFAEIIGIVQEDYETGGFNQFNWIQGIYPWVIDSVSFYEGSYSSRSAIGLPDNAESELSISVNVISPGDISFFKFVSSEEDYDYLKFKINGNKLAEWSGLDTGWSFVSFPVNSTGQTVFKWEYEKDNWYGAGDDCAWIDYIVFPPLYLAPSSISESVIEFKIFPSPTLGILNIDFGDLQKREIHILDIKGTVLDILSVNSNNSQFDISDYSSGAYHIKIMPDNVIYPIVKQ
ncbi:MAG: C25 family cysteine peptidase [Bacteroidota bacterium]|nr:C25 family cysteine peptidase [Bacteroidota bacterium]